MEIVRFSSLPCILYTPPFDTERSASIFNVKTPNFYFFYFKKALTVLRGPLACPNGRPDLHIETFGRTPWPGDQPDARTTQHRNTRTHIHAPTRIRPCDPNVQAAVDSTCLRPLGYWDRQFTSYRSKYSHENFVFRHSVCSAIRDLVS
jgi:hypothetical protein